MSEPTDDPNGLAGIPITTKAHSVEVLMKARVILGTDGPETIFFEAVNMSIKAPGFAFPFVKNGALVTVIVGVVQVTGPEAEPLVPQPRIIRPGSH